jgi:hypothetical protein
LQPLIFNAENVFHVVLLLKLQLVSNLKGFFFSKIFIEHLSWVRPQVMASVSLQILVDEAACITEGFC